MRDGTTTIRNLKTWRVIACGPGASGPGKHALRGAKIGSHPPLSTRRHAPSHPGHHPQRRAAPQPGAAARGRPGRARVGHRQGQRLRPRHRARVRGPARRRRLRPDRPGRGRARARPGLARAHPAARRRVRAARSGAVLAAESVAHRALRRADRLAGHAQDARAAPGVSQAQLGHEPPGFCARALSRRPRPPVGTAPGRGSCADDALCRRRRRQGHQRAMGRVRTRHRRSARRAQRVQQRRHPAPWAGCGRARRLGAPRHRGLRRLARPPPAHRRALGPATGHEPERQAAGRAAARGRRHRGLRLHLHRARAHAHRRGRLRLCRRLPAPRRHRHARAGGWRAHPHPGAREHGHAGGGPERRAAGRARQRSHAVGPLACWRGAAHRRGGAGGRHHRL